MSDAGIINYLLMFFEKPVDYDDFLNAEPEECATLFFANAKAQKWNLWAMIIMKWILTSFILLGLPLFTLPFVTGGSYDVWIDTQDYYFICAMGQVDGFTEELYNGDWVFQKYYLKQIARDLYANPTPLFYTRALFKLMEVFEVMGDGAI